MKRLKVKTTIVSVTLTNKVPVNGGQIDHLRASIWVEELCYTLRAIVSNLTSVPSSCFIGIWFNICTCRWWIMVVGGHLMLDWYSKRESGIVQAFSEFENGI